MMDQISGSLTPEILVPRLGDYLLDRGLINNEELRYALAVQSDHEKSGKPMLLGQILIDLGKIDQMMLDQVVTEQILILKNALEESNRELERRVMERTSELEEALLKINKLNAIKSNLISNISHELRTPLTHIKGYLDLFVTGDLGAITEDQRKTLQIMNRASEKLEKLIDELITFSIGENEELIISFENFDLVLTIRRIIEQFQKNAPKRQILFPTSYGEGEIWVCADRKKIEWVIDQLIENAFKFSNAGLPIQIMLEAAPERVRIIVSDQGIGISEEKMMEIFEPFHQIDGSSTRKYGGIGLGLTLAQKILSAHASQLRVQSKINVGSQFDFSLKRLIK